MGTLTVSPHVLTDQFDFNADPWSALKKIIRIQVMNITI